MPEVDIGQCQPDKGFGSEEAGREAISPPIGNVIMERVLSFLDFDSGLGIESGIAGT